METQQAVNNSRNLPSVIAACRSRLVAATLYVRRKRLVSTYHGIHAPAVHAKVRSASLQASRKIVPPSADSNRPSLR